MERFCEDRLCPKCGGHSNTKHVTRWVHEKGKSWVVGEMVDAMERTCTRCGYVWDELPLDA